MMQYHNSLVTLYKINIFSILMALGLLFSGVAYGQPNPEREGIGKYTVKVTGISEPRILENALKALEIYQRSLVSSNKKPIPAYDWLRLQESAHSQVQNATKPFGYYRAETKLVVRRPNQIELEVDLGSPLIVQKVSLLIDGDAQENPEIRQWLADFPLKTGSVLVQPDYDAAKARLNILLRRYGYLDARYAGQSIKINAERSQAEVNLDMKSGIRHRYGQISIKWRNTEGAGVYQDGFVDSYVSISSGDFFNSEQLQALQAQLADSGYFSYAQVRPGFADATNGVVPIEVVLDVPKRFEYGASLGAGTDTGIRAGVRYEDKRFNPKGHRLTASGNVSSVRQSVTAGYAMPKNGKPRDGYRLYSSFLEENSDVRDSRTWSLGLDRNVSLSRNSQLSFGLSFRQDRFTENTVTNENHLLLPRISWQTVSADDLRAPARGYRLSASLVGASDELGSDLSFVQLNLNAKTVYKLGRGRVLGRAEIGQTLIADEDTLASSFKFFAGGDYSVRGYDFESIGVANGSNDLTGGENVAVASLEYEHQVIGNWSLAAFVDAGDAYDDRLDLKVGIGVGARWRLPFGAIRLDLAQAQDLSGKPTRVHFTFGTDL